MIVADINLLAYLLISGPFTAAAQRVFDKDSDWLAPEIWSHELLKVSIGERYLSTPLFEQE